MFDPPKKRRTPEDAIAAIVDSLNKSPLRDSLGFGEVRKSWEDKGVLGSYEGGSPMVNIRGDFDQPSQGGIPSSKRDVRSTFVHETGHALQAHEKGMFPKWDEVAKGLPTFTTQNNKSPGRNSSLDGYTRARFPDDITYHHLEKERFDEGSLMRKLLPFMEPGRKMTGSESQAFKALDPYYVGKIPGQTEDSRSQPNEQFAQAFTNAFSFLSETAENPGDYRRRIGELEGATPGMGQVVLDLLRQPQFANHPLKSAFGVK